MKQYWLIKILIQIQLELSNSHEFIDNSLGLILRNTSELNVILTDGTLIVPSEIRIELPNFKSTGQCSLKNHTISQMGWLKNNGTGFQDYSRKIGALNALIHADMITESNKIVEKLQNRLGNIKTNKVFSEEATSEFAANPKLCDNPMYRCEFHVPAVPMKCTHDGGQKIYPEGHVIKGFTWNWTRSKSYQNFKGLSCGNILAAGETDHALTYTIGPSICCESGSDKKYRSCPSEAIKAMENYNLKAQNTEHELEIGNTYCISVRSMKKRPPSKNRKKRSFLQYWSVGGGLTSNYIDNKSHSIKTVLDHKIDVLRNEVKGNKDIIQSISSTTSTAMSEIERLMCTNSLDLWSQVMQININEIVQRAHFEIESSFRACEDGNLPFTIEENIIRKLCYAATTNDLKGCNYITLLASCVTKDIILEGNDILLHIELKLQLPSSEINLRHKLLEAFPVPNQALESINTVIKEDKPKNVQNIDTINNKTVETIESLFTKIINRVNDSNNRKKRDVTLYNYLSIDIPKLHIFYTESNVHQFIAFYECKKKPPIQYCTLGENEYRGKTCLEAILSQKQNTIKKTCPVRVITGNNCIVTKLERAFLISTYTDIEIFDDTINRKSIFASKSNTCEAHKVCIVEPKENEQLFYCNGLKYSLPQSKHDNIQNNITLTNNTNFSLLNFDFKGINDSLEKLKVIQIPSIKPIVVTEQHKDIMLWIIMAVLAIALIIGTSVLTCRCYKKCYDPNRNNPNNTTIVEFPLNSITSENRKDVSQIGSRRRTDSQSSVRLLGI